MLRFYKPVSLDIILPLSSEYVVGVPRNKVKRQKMTNFHIYLWLNQAKS